MRVPAPRRSEAQVGGRFVQDGQPDARGRTGCDPLASCPKWHNTEVMEASSDWELNDLSCNNVINRCIGLRCRNTYHPGHSARLLSNERRH